MDGLAFEFLEWVFETQLLQLLHRRIAMKKNISAVSLQRNLHLQPQLSLASFLASRVHPEGLRSVRSTNNSNMEPISHEQSFDGILKRFRVGANSQRDLQKSVLSIHKESKATKRQRMIQGESAVTDRIRKNLQVLKQKYILLPDIHTKFAPKKHQQSPSDHFPDDTDYDKFGRTALKLRKLKKKPRRDKENERKQPLEGGER